LTSAQNLIGGTWGPARDGRTYGRHNPARPAELVGEFPLSGPADVKAAVEAAQEALAGWSRMSAPKRAELLLAGAATVEARGEQMAADMTREMGKPLREARAEVARAAAILRFFAGEAYRPVGELYEQTAGGRVLTTRRPVGVVGLITPWNFPTAIPAWKAGPALAFGNTVVLKASPDAPISAFHLATCLQESGLPPGVLNVVLGAGPTAGAALVADPGVAAISFTGSVATGRLVRDRATAQGKRVQCELGGQNPLIVTGDADLSRAAEAAYAGAFWSAGQKCTATRRIYVERSVYDEFRRLFLARVDVGRVGDPTDPETEVGPLGNEAQFRGVVESIERARAEGGRVIAGGSHSEDGYYIQPTVFEDVADSALLSCEEVFGPVVSLYPYETLDEAILRANATTMGLSAAIFTSDVATVARFSHELEAGILHVNSQTAGAEVHVPFGGIKSSGWGPHEQGRATREFYTDVITIYQDT
jgi:acyl-CoA reductase-like NAD-dependent aldehyde dehydrogenase